MKKQYYIFDVVFGQADKTVVVVVASNEERALNKVQQQFKGQNLRIDLIRTAVKTFIAG